MICDTFLVAEDDLYPDLDLIRTETARARRSLREAFEQSPAVLARSEDREELWILSGETNPNEGKLRVTELWTDGPGGHFSGQSLDEIVKEKANRWSTYQPVDEDFVIDWTSTDEWNEGLQRVAYVQAHNQLMWVAGKQGEHASDEQRSRVYRWAMDQTMKARQIEDIEQATKMLERAAADLQAGRAPNGIPELRRRLMPPGR